MIKYEQQSVIERLGKQLKEALPESMTSQEVEQIQSLFQLYYQHIALTDLAEHEANDLLGALVAHWHLIRQRKPGEAKCRVYNPEQEEYGWHSNDTIIEVVTDDMPFLVDSISSAINQRGIAISLTIHPVYQAVRSEEWKLLELHPQGELVQGGIAEAATQIYIERQPPEMLLELKCVIDDVITDVYQVTGDWQPMKSQVERVRGHVSHHAATEQCPDSNEIKAFIEWLLNDHFLFIAACEYGVNQGDEEHRLHYIQGSGLGLMRDKDGGNHWAEEFVVGLSLEQSAFECDLLVTKANQRSTVHRSAYMDFVAVKNRNEQGNVCGLYCFVGLFSSSAYSFRPRQIPLLRKKVDQVFEKAQIPHNSHSGRAIDNILDNFPRDALFQIGVDDLLATTLGVMGLQERQRTRLFIVEDSFQRFYTCLVYLPRERYSREVRLAIQDILIRALEGTDVVFDTHFSESILARIHFVVRIESGSQPVFNIDELEAEIAQVTTSWQDGLREALFKQMDEVLASSYLRDYGNAFPGGYREDFHPRIAVSDIQRIETARDQQRLILHLYQPIEEDAGQVHVRLYSPERPVSLSQAIPVLEHMGLSVFGERPYRIKHPKGDAWIHDFSTRRISGAVELLPEVNNLFVDAFQRVWEGDINADGFNGLVLRAGISWRQALLFRAYTRYLHQINAPYTQAYTIDVLNRHPEVVKLLSRLFRLRFSPEESGNTAFEELLAKEFDGLLENVSSLDEDRILRSFLNMIQATLRTNFFTKDAKGFFKSYLSFKIEPEKVNGMPKPMPMFEIFVFSSYMEGVHLRGGRVARGGLRWSDRMEDYRTEILGLMKAQMVKNTVIVPVGSKGGFIVKNSDPEDTREEQMEKVVTAYKTLLRGMLDITDNLVDGKVVPPEDVIRHDSDDPYLVIAADKGTATFSDIANGVSADYGFWLGDAFASGGSAGYDHKAMGITAKGAWESVKRSFRELGVDTQNEDITVIGIGDMSGDVFGNGMLLSRHIRLLGAFNHLHIFIDPNPDAETSYEERARLFKLPRSSWGDYNKKLISRGGRVFPRDAKSVSLSPEIRTLLGLSEERMPPNELISALLRAPVDLLWNGGIGTYVKASSETHEQVRDKANDGLRVSASELQCRVVGEGGNLGFTQLARVEYAMAGGRIYTDAIDNSAGVDCSDHEVNIKILLDKIVSDGDLTLKQRNQLLEQMTDDVANLVLADNYAQTEAISIVEEHGVSRVYEQARLMDLLEQKGHFDRQLEGLPSRKALTDRQAHGQGLTKPELAVLLAYSKMNFFEAIVQSDTPDDPFVQELLINYFPPALGKRYPNRIMQHQLKREILATVIAGNIANKMGPGIGFRIREEVGSDIAGVAKSFLVVSAIFKTDELWVEIARLDNSVPAAIQIEMLSMISDFLKQMLTALLRGYKDCMKLTPLKERFFSGAQELWSALPKPLAAQDKSDFERRVRRFTGKGVPKPLAQRISGLVPMAATLDIVEVSHDTGKSINNTAWIYSALGHTLDLDWVNKQIAELTVQTHWHLLARTKMNAMLNGYRRHLTAEVLKAGNSVKSARGILEHWVHQNRAMLDRYEETIAEFKATAVYDFAILSLIVARVGELLPTGRGKGH